MLCVLAMGWLFSMLFTSSVVLREQIARPLLTNPSGGVYTLRRPDSQQKKISGVAGNKKEGLIDDSIDVDEEDVEIQRKPSLQHQRNTMERGKTHPVQHKLGGIEYCPLLRPLSVSDIDSCVALENAAFKSEQHRCTPAKACCVLLLVLFLFLLHL